MNVIDERHQAAVEACRSLARALLEQTGHEDSATLAAIEQKIGEGCALQLDIDLGTGRIGLNVYDGAVSVQVGVVEGLQEVWAPPENSPRQ